LRLIERIWTGDKPADRLARLALAPLEGLYRSAMGFRAQLYDRGIMPVRRSPIAVVSVGNITVGGTGKTPVSAWLAARLVALDRNPAVVLRGYGDDEPLVHATINPNVPVIVSPDRRRGIEQAASGGADVAILDDAFQHRRAGRDLDLVLISADAWTRSQRVLPAGPFREPLSQIRRASAILVTQKAATVDRVAEVMSALREAAPGAPLITVRLSPAELVRADSNDTRLPAAALAERRVLAIAGVADPAAFFRQLELLGAKVTARPFADHHTFTRAEIADLAEAASGFDYVACTLKDAVKLRPMWPAGGPPLWYVSLSVEVLSGASTLDEMLARLAGSRRPEPL